MSRKQTAESFWARVKPVASGCWEWQGSCNNTGYGSVKWHNKTYVAHRVAAWLSGLVGTPAAPPHGSSTFALHKCDNRKCCNPAHLFLGSFSDNQLDAYTKGRQVQPRGAEHANAKLSNRQVAAIRRAYAKGNTRQADLASRYGVSQRCVSLIVRRETYA